MASYCFVGNLIEKALFAVRRACEYLIYSINPSTIPQPEYDHNEDKIDN